MSATAQALDLPKLYAVNYPTRSVATKWAK
jgi:hypothetical protein